MIPKRFIPRPGGRLRGSKASIPNSVGLLFGLIGLFGILFYIYWRLTGG